MEAEAVECFEEHYFWHAQCGELSDRPGFCALELFFEITDHAFPFWSATLMNPKHGFPNTCKFIDEEMEGKGLVDMADMKRA